MSITTTEVKTIFTGSGSFTFDYQQAFLTETDLVVKERTVATGVEVLFVLNTDYTVTETNDDFSGGATITTLAASALTSTSELVVERKVPQVQSTDYPEAQPFPAQSTEDALDKLTLLVQQMQSQIDDCLRVPDTDGEPGRLANSVDRAEKYLTFDENGLPIQTVDVAGAAPASPSNPIITSGAGAPGSAPGKIGDIYIDTTNDVPYIGVDTSASTDFKNCLELIADTTPQLFADLDANTNAITGVTTIDTSGGYKIGTNLVFNVDDTNRGTFVGLTAGVLSTGADNTAIGRDALAANTTGFRNTAVGEDALLTITTGQKCVAVGTSCLRVNTADSNIGMGYLTLFANTSGTLNTGIGDQSLSTNITGARNSALGADSLKQSTGDDNVGIGYDCGNPNTGDKNVILGAFSLNNKVAGDGCITIGYASGDNLTSGSRNMCISTSGDFPSTTASNQLNIGNVIWGSNASGTGTTAAGQISIGTNTPTLDVILELASTTAAFMPPRMTTSQRDDAGFTPAEGMLIYNLTTHVLDHYNGTAWGAV